MLTDQQKLIFTTAVQTIDTVWRIYRDGYQIGTEDERETKESVLLDGDDDERDLI